ncbi:MAG: NADH-quinone oxidoreductase subunit NuoK [Paenibacillaceae bacterium]|jgi:NADH-quinone oxidoreductase subunit K|nr:NADH-quinone oxidoreductase subunit NuoK [Paenibacillaceae bacterium]
MTQTMTAYVLLAALLFVLGLYGVLTRREPIVVLLCVEVMLQAVALNVLAFAKYGGFEDVTGHVFVLFILAVSAAEVAVGVAVFLALVRQRGVDDVVKLDTLHAERQEE